MDTSILLTLAVISRMSITRLCLSGCSIVAALVTSPGRPVETEADFNVIYNWPEYVDSTLNIFGEQFFPHGFTIDFNEQIALTSDFVVTLSILSLLY